MTFKILTVLFILAAVTANSFLARSAAQSNLSLIADVLIVLLSIAVAGKYIRIYRRREETKTIVIAGLFTMIGTIHALRFLFGGLPI